MRIGLNIPKQTSWHPEDTAIDIPPPPTTRDLVRQEMRIHRNADFDKRIVGIFDTFLFVCLASMTAYYLSLED